MYILLYAIKNQQGISTSDGEAMVVIFVFNDGFVVQREEQWVTFTVIFHQRKKERCFQCIEVKRIILN